MKRLRYNMLSGVVCNHKGCSKKIKLRLIRKEKPNTLCYEHHCMKEARRNHFINVNQRKKRIEAGLPVKQSLHGGGYGKK